MVDRRTIQELLEKDPFQRFRIFMSDGHAYEVTNPGVVVPMDTKVFVALPEDHWKFLSYAQVTRIESIETQAA